MTRAINVHGEAMLYIKGPAGSAYPGLTELGLSDNDVRIEITPLFRDVIVNAWGDAPADVQRKLAYVTCTATLIQFDLDVLAELTRLAMGGNQEGRVGRAGRLMGNGLGRFVAGNNYVGFNLAAPQNGRPWRFLSAYLQAPVGAFMLGTNAETVTVTFRGVPYTPDPWNGGAGADQFILYDRVMDA